MKTRNTENPSFEVEFVKTDRMFDEAGEARVNNIIKWTENHLKTKHNSRLTGGLTYSVIRVQIDAEGPDPEEVEEVVTDSKPGICSTTFV